MLYSTCEMRPLMLSMAAGHAVVDAYALRCRDMPSSDLQLSAGSDIACDVSGELERYT
jgi:hypothetical protein